MAIVDATGPELELVYVNSGLEELTGYSRDEALGQGFGFLTGPGTDTSTLASIADSLGDGDPWHVTILCYRKDGTPFWNDIAGSPLYGYDGTLLRWIIFCY